MIFAVQDEIPEYKLTDMIDFEAEIYDLQDGWLFGNFFLGEDSPVIWMYGGLRYFHNSELSVFPFELAPGVHTFTVIATNSVGLSTQKDFSFIIIDDDSDLPDDWSREDFKTGLSWGLVVPLDRLDAPVTRGTYAEMLTQIYGLFAMFTSGLDYYDPAAYNNYPDYEEGVVTDGTSKWDLWHWFVVVKLGIMEAPDGIFNPIGSVTELEALVMLYRIGALALNDPQVLDINADEDAIVEWCIDKGIINTIGPNAFNGSQRLTNKLAMVRQVRFMEDITWHYLADYFS